MRTRDKVTRAVIILVVLAFGNRLWIARLKSTSPVDMSTTRQASQVKDGAGS
jgi:hypothetical protein